MILLSRKKSFHSDWFDDEKLASPKGVVGLQLVAHGPKVSLGTTRPCALSLQCFYVPIAYHKYELSL